MPIFKRLAALASAGAAARAYAKRNPDKVNRMASKAGDFLDKQTKGKYRNQIDGAKRRVRSFTGDQRPDAPPAR